MNSNFGLLKNEKVANSLMLFAPQLEDKSYLPAILAGVLLGLAGIWVWKEVSPHLSDTLKGKGVDN